MVLLSKPIKHHVCGKYDITSRRANGQLFHKVFCDSMWGLIVARKIGKLNESCETERETETGTHREMERERERGKGR